MKKIVSVCLVLLLLFAVTLCGCQRMSAEAVMLRASSNLEKLDGVEMQGSMNITLATTGISMEIPLQFHAYMDGLKGESPVLLFELGATFMQQDIQMTGYQENDYQYTVMKAGGQTIKSKQPVEKEEEDSEGFFSFLKGLDAESLKDIEITYEQDGSKELAFTVAGESLGKLFNITELTGEGAVAEDSTLYCTVGRDGYLHKVAFTLKMSNTDATTSIKATYTLDTELEFLNLGKDITVTPPEGYLEFPEGNGGGLFA